MYAVIMAGGRGTRFWPKSREKKPKHLLDIISARTIVQETFDRIKLLVPTENILVVTGKSHADELASQLPEIPPNNIIIEPIGRNTAPCIGLAALHIKKKIDDVMIVLPADHLITDVGNFLEILNAAAQKANEGSYLITVGIKPSSPETGYGYLEQGNIIDNINGKIIYKVKSIREKPSLEQAKNFLQQGDFLWNSGIFIWKSSSILNEIQRWLPRLYNDLIAIEKVMETKKDGFIPDGIYRNIKPISIDYGVMEKTHHALLVRADFGWSDVGSWDALWEISEKDENGNAIKGHFSGLNAKNSLIHGSQKKLIALIDVEDLIVVETHDALLVCKRGSSQKVKKMVEILENKGLTEYI